MLLLDVPDEKLLTIAKDIPETNLLQTSSTTKSQQKKSKAEEELIDLIPEEEEKDEKLSPTKSKVKPKTYTFTLHFLFRIYYFLKFLEFLKLSLTCVSQNIYLTACDIIDYDQIICQESIIK